MFALNVGVKIRCYAKVALITKMARMKSGLFKHNGELSGGRLWQELAEKAQGGDKRAYSHLLKDLSVYVRRYLVGQLANPDWVDDITQDVLISVHKSLHTYSSDRAFMPWLHAIIQFRKTDFLRKHYKVRKTKESVKENRDIFDQNVTNPVGMGEIRDIEAALRELPEKQRIIVEDMKIHGYSAKEVAKKLGMTDTAVKVSAHRAINKLKDKLG